MKHKKIVASLLIASLVVTSASFSTLAATVETVANAHAKKFKEERIKLPFKYSNLLDNVCGRYLMGDDDIDEALKDKVPSKSASYSDADSDDEDDGVNTTYTDEPEEDGQENNNTEDEDNKGAENTTNDDNTTNTTNTENLDSNNDTSNDNEGKTDSAKATESEADDDLSASKNTNDEAETDNTTESNVVYETGNVTIPTKSTAIKPMGLENEGGGLFGAGECYLKREDILDVNTKYPDSGYDNKGLSFQIGGTPAAGYDYIKDCGDGLYIYVYKIGFNTTLGHSEVKYLIYSPDKQINLPSDCTNLFCSWGHGWNECLDFTGVKTSNVTNMSGMFMNCKMEVKGLGSFDTSNVTNMSYMFSGYNGSRTVDVTSFDTSKVTDMSYMFGSFYLNNIDITNFDTANVTNMRSMFSHFAGESIDVSSFDTSNVTNMSFMFYDCINLKNINITNFDTNKVTNLSAMFLSCEHLKNLDLTSFITNNITDMSNMFKNCATLSTIYTNNDFSTTALVNSTEMFKGCGVLKGGNGTKYSVALVEDASYAKVDRDGVPGYFTKKVTPTSTPTPTPTTPRGGDPTPPGGGGGSSSRGGSLLSSNNGQGQYIDFVVHTVTNKSNIEWVYDAQGNKDGAKIKKESPLAKSLMGEAKHRNRYIDTNDKDYIQLKSGYYKVELPAGGYYLGFDDKGKMIKGFIYTTEQTEDYNIDVLQSKLVEISTKNSAKYYLMKGTTEYAGIVWNIPIAIRDKAYYFDPQGRVTREEPLGQVNALSASQVITKGPIHIGNKVYRIDYEGALYEVK